jgi:hypothetical protein
MFGFNARKQGPGQPIVARTINRPATQTERSARLKVGPGLAQVNIAGSPKIRKIERRDYLVRLTAVGTGADAGKYAWREIEPHEETPGAWVDKDARFAGAIGDDPLFEYNLNATLTVGMKVNARRMARTGELRALYGKCT